MTSLICYSVPFLYTQHSRIIAEIFKSNALKVLKYLVCNIVSTGRSRWNGGEHCGGYCVGCGPHHCWRTARPPALPLRQRHLLQLQHRTAECLALVSKHLVSYIRFLCLQAAHLCKILILEYLPN